MKLKLTATSALLVKNTVTALTTLYNVTGLQRILHSTIYNRYPKKSHFTLKTLNPKHTFKIGKKKVNEKRD